MRRSNFRDHLVPEHSALQHERAPRPLPLFLAMVRMLAEEQPETARLALKGLSAYERASRPPERTAKPELARVGPAALRDYGGSGPPAILIPSLINPPNILDLDEETSLAAAVTQMGRRALLLDWGAASPRSGFDIAQHVEQLLLPLIDRVDAPPALIGYCLGGTMAIAAANVRPVERVATLASPWVFERYPSHARTSLQRIWAQTDAAAAVLGVLPMEVLQAAFWSLDPQRTVTKFAKFAGYAEGSDEALQFIALEDWANEGDPLPYPAARELMEDFFAAGLPGRGKWMVSGRPMTAQLEVPVLHLTAGKDRIAPAATAPPGFNVEIASGHVGMVVGSAGAGTREALAAFLDPLAGSALGG